MFAAEKKIFFFNFYVKTIDQKIFEIITDPISSSEDSSAPTPPRDSRLDNIGVMSERLFIAEDKLACKLKKKISVKSNILVDKQLR